ncbi:5-formyltetrahydrofolate cyclo-ligase [Lichenicoccus sp.]|uniref:5-formyltetrahydrofolate cyclo-ligase n=1 Tax=Lichenicoccus sp. TaxID=2781899 RepID=UPI003D124DBE
MMPLDSQKRALRIQLLRSRTTDPAADARLSRALLAHVAMPPGARIGGVWPLPDEPDLRPLWHRLHERGCAVLLPETTPRGSALRFRPWSPGCAMEAGPHGTAHPAGPASDVPEIVFVPMLAFDRQGWRLGYGGGYYDRTLVGLPQARAIGFALSSQQVEAVPHGAFDIRLPMIVTEQGPVRLHRQPEG